MGPQLDGAAGVTAAAPRGSSGVDATPTPRVLEPAALRRRLQLAGRVAGLALALFAAVGAFFELLAHEPFTHLGVLLVGLAVATPMAWRGARLVAAAALVGMGATLFASGVTSPEDAPMAPTAAAIFIVTGLVVALQESRREGLQKLAVLLGITALLGCLTLGVAWIYGTNAAIGLPQRLGMTLPAVITISLAIMALRLARPDHGFLGVVSSSSTASVFLLLMVPATVFVPPFIGLLYLEAGRQEVVAPELGQALVTIATVLVLGAFILWTTRRIVRLEARRREDEAALRRARDELERRVDERTGELAESTARWRSVLDGVSASIITVGTDGKAIDFNRTAERWLGYRADEIVGQHGPALWHDPEDFARHVRLREAELGRTFVDPAQAFVAGLKRDGSNAFECVYRRKDGTTFPVLLSITRIDDRRGKPIGFTGVAVDIAERRAAEEALTAAKDKAEAATRARAEFVARMSHELRTPLNGVIGFLALALDTRLDDEQREFVSGAHEAATSLLRLVDDILDFSKIDARKLALEAIPMTLAAVLESALRPLAMKARARGLGFEIDVADDVPDRLTGDPTRLSQVLVNLVGNAVKFTERGKIKTRVTLADDRPGAVTLRFAVQDSGIGIPHDKVARIFEPFGQGDEATTRRFGGTGLGLPIAAELVRMMGGALTVESVPGEGATFTFTVELAKRVPTAVQPRPIVAQRRLRLLVAEDNPTNLLLATRLLERAGHEVTGVTDGKKAVAAALSNDFDVVLMDVQMPEIDGLEATRIIRASENGVHGRLPIVGLTAQVQAGDDQRCLEAGMDAYVAKPFDPHQLIAAIDRVAAARA